MAAITAPTATSTRLPPSVRISRALSPTARSLPCLPTPSANCAAVNDRPK